MIPKELCNKLKQNGFSQLPTHPWDLYYYGDHIFTIKEIEQLRNSDYTPVSYLDQCVKIPSWHDVGINLITIIEKYLETISSK